MSTAAIQSRIILSTGTVQEKMPSANSGDNELRQAARDFEALFIHKMLQTMRKTVPEDTILNGGLVEDIYTDMMDQEVAKAAAERESLGIASMIYDQMSGAVQER